MGKDSKIEWTDHTFNPWYGCTKISPGCANCYAESWAKRFGVVQWGPNGTRRRTSVANWNQPVKWNKAAAASGQRAKVFCASLADVFEDHPSIDPQWRADLWALIRATPNLDWLLLTKRPENLSRYLPDPWVNGWPNVWLGTTAENQEMANERIPYLMAAPAAKHFVSAEPLLGPINFHAIEIEDTRLDALLGLQHDPYHGEPVPGPRLDLVIAGGESGPKARPMHPDWARSLRDQCAAAGVAFHHKQNGEWVCVYDRDRDDPDWSRCPHAKDNTERYVNIVGGHGFHNERVIFMRRVGKAKAGRLLDGAEHNGRPE